MNYFDEKRFWFYVKKAGPDDCWLWQGGVGHWGHGRFWLQGKTKSAHVIAYLETGKTIPEGLELRHLCNVPACVNPKHLLPGTHKENMQDAIDCKSIARGSAHGKSKLVDEQVEEIFEFYHLDELSQTEIAKQFNITRSVVSRILRGDSWRHIYDRQPKSFKIEHQQDVSKPNQPTHSELGSTKGDN